MRFFINKNTRLLKASNFWQQGLQNESIQQPYSPCRSKKLNFKGEIENNFHKNLNFHSKFFPLVIWSKKNWRYTLSGWISWQITSNWWFLRNVDSDLVRAQTSGDCFIPSFHILIHCPSLVQGLLPNCPNLKLWPLLQLLQTWTITSAPAEASTACMAY